jgi:hypothetical protein
MGMNAEVPVSSCVSVYRLKTNSINPTSLAMNQCELKLLMDRPHASDGCKLYKEANYTVAIDML